ncbi:MAG: KH domain-containing protein [Lachnospiraceae bacterium]|nr:KH domain-containing protein [Lachnospiraceae bacterium]
MADYREFSAKTVSDCITDACMTFSVTSDRLDYEVVTEGSSGFIGIGVKPAVIKARVKEESFETLEAEQATKRAAEEAERKEKKEREAAEKAAKREAEKKENAERAAAIREREGIPEVTDEDVKAWKEKRRQERKERGNGRGGRRFDRDRDNRNRENEVSEEPVVVEEKPAKPVREIPEEEKAALQAAAEAFLKDVFASMKIEATISCTFTPDNTLSIELSGEEMGILIGKRGQTLDSLQYLTSLVVNKGTEEYVRVKVDTENYRRRRRETLEKLAKNIAFKVKRSRRPVALEPMNPYERRIIHSALQGDRYVTTHSEGDEPYRKVVVTLKNGR